MSKMTQTDAKTMSSTSLKHFTCSKLKFSYGYCPHNLNIISESNSVRNTRKKFFFSDKAIFMSLLELAKKRKEKKNQQKLKKELQYLSVNYS